MGAKRKKGPRFLSCLCGSSVFSDELSSGRIEGRKTKKRKQQQKAPNWFSWWRVRKKKKTAPCESSSAAAASSSSPEELPRKCFCRKPVARAQDNENDSDAQQLNTAASQLQEAAADADSLPQPPLPSPSAQPSTAQTKPIQTGRNPDPNQTRTSANQPSRPRRSAHRTASNRDPVRTSRPKQLAGLWVMATTLGVMISFGRASAVVFLCSCMYIMPLLRARAAREGSAAGDRANNPKGVDLDSEEYKKKVIMEGLLERNGRRPSYAS